MNRQIDLNCDLGEWKSQQGRELDKSIMPFISSCNVACGGHIGDETSMKATIELAQSFDVAIGAHPAYPDKTNFGRAVIDISPEALGESIGQQIETFRKYLNEAGTELHHIKPHGALYNQAAKDEQTAKIVLSSIKNVAPGIKVYLPDFSISSVVAKDFGLEVIHEVFADRVYEDDLNLRSRSFSDAVLHDEADVIAQIRQLALNGHVLTYSGLEKSLTAETVCLHSDTPGAIHLAKAINKFLHEHGVTITAP